MSNESSNANLPALSGDRELQVPETQEAINWREEFYLAMQEYIGVTTPEEAIAKSVELARYWQQKERDYHSDFRGMFPEGKELDAIAQDVIDFYVEMDEAYGLRAGTAPEPTADTESLPPALEG